MDYLADEVLDQQPRGVREFLLHTSILDRLRGPLCDALLETISADKIPGSSQEILEYLERSNLFVVPLDSKRRWYRYHRLFADQLQCRLHRTQPQRIPELHRRASAWYEANDYIPEAVRHALADPDPSRAVGLVERYAMPMLFHSETRTTLGWFEALPDEAICTHPMLRVQYAWALALAEQTSSRDAVALRLDAAERALNTEDVAPELRDLVLGHVATIRTYMLQPTTEADYDPGQVIALSHQALALLPEDELGIRSVNGLQIGNAHWALGDLPAALAAYQETFDLARTGGNLYVAVYALLNQALIASYQGRLRQAAELCRTGLREFGALLEKTGQRLPATGGLHIVLGSILLEWNELEEAEGLLLQGTGLIRWTGERSTQMLGYAALLRLRQAQGDTPGAEVTLSELEKAWPEGRVYSGALRARYQLWRSASDPDARSAAVRWAQEQRLDLDTAGEARGMNSWEELEQLLQLAWMRVQMAQAKNLDPVLAYLERQLELAETHGLADRVIELSILQALALEALGETDRALDALTRALKPAEPEGYVRLFVDEGAPLARLLYLAAARKLAPEYAGRLLSAFPENEWTPVTPPQTQPEIIEPLSQREIEVLQLIAEGLTNREIAQRLFLSPYTVRAHASNIYGKLSVRNRTEAVDKARALGILPPIATQ
jgi:LuxR family maltose regulon positive regulatory protein